MQTITTAGKLIFSITIKNAKQRSYLLSVFAMLCAFSWINYSGLLNGSTVLNRLTVFLFPFLSLSIAFLLQIVFWKNAIFAGKPWFWILVIAAPLIFAGRYWVQFPKELIFGQSFPVVLAAQYVWRSIILILPVLIIWFFKDRKRMHFYSGTTGVNWKICCLLLLSMLPIIFIAAHQPEFAAVYPKAVMAAKLTTGSPAWQWILFELAYAIDFIGIEIFCRGFLIMAFVRFVGPMAIVPAACFYCCIHFNKPMPEAISSFFGGLLLGSISYFTRNIWAGLLLHVAMAWLMELVCFYLYHP